MDAKATGPLRIGVSACLLGTPSRWDGSHDRLEALVAEGARVTFVPVCPEADAGLPTPREPAGLVGPREEPRMVGHQTGRDYTATVQGFSRARVQTLLAEGIDGFVLQARSPSCGVGSTKRQATPGAEPVRDGTGLFAAALLERAPDLPVAERTEVADPEGLARFLERAAAYRSRRLAAGKSCDDGSPEQ